ncbi:MAG: LysR family transcriptional regulator [Sphingomonadaceae bacterium]
MSLNLHHLRLFQAIAHAGGLSAAAGRLNLSPPALSAQLRQLEGQLGVPLFDRVGRRLELTEAGRIALAHADSIFATADELVATLRNRPAGRRILRVGAIATLSRNFQLAFLKAPLLDPDIAVAIRSGPEEVLLAALAALELDVVLTNRVPADAGRGWRVHAIADQPVSLVGTSGRIGSGRTLAELMACEPLVLPAAGSAVRAGFDALAERMGLAPRIAAEADDMAMLRLIARADIGLAVLPAVVVRDELASGELTEAGHLPGLHETFLAVTTPRRFPNPLVAALVREGARA